MRAGKTVIYPDIKAKWLQAKALGIRLLKAFVFLFFLLFFFPSQVSATHGPFHPFNSAAVLCLSSTSCGGPPGCSGSVTTSSANGTYTLPPVPGSTGGFPIGTPATGATFNVGGLSGSCNFGECYKIDVFNSSGQLLYTENGGPIVNGQISVGAAGNGNWAVVSPGSCSEAFEPPPPPPSPRLMVAPPFQTILVGQTASYKAFYDPDGPEWPELPFEVTTLATWGVSEFCLAFTLATGCIQHNFDTLSSLGGGQFRGDLPSPDPGGIGNPRYPEIWANYGVSAFALLEVNPRDKATICDPEKVGTDQVVGCAWNDARWQGFPPSLDPGFSLNGIPNKGELWDKMPDGPKVPTAGAVGPVPDDFSPIPYTWWGLGNITNNTPPLIKDNVLVQWRGKFKFKAGTYRFHLGSAGNARLYIDNDPVTNAAADTASGEPTTWNGATPAIPTTGSWAPGRFIFGPGPCPQTNCKFFDKTFATAGLHTLRVELWDGGGNAGIHLRWAKKPEVDLRLRKAGTVDPFVDGPISINNNQAVELQWSSTNAGSCVASTAPSATIWTGLKPVSGTAATAALTDSQTFTINCTGPGGVAADSATVNVSSDGSIAGKLIKDVNGDGIKQASEVYLQEPANACTGEAQAGFTVSMQKGVTTETAKADLCDASGPFYRKSLSPGTYNLSLAIPAGWEIIGLATDSRVIGAGVNATKDWFVRPIPPPPPPSLSVVLSATPASGSAPLNTQLSADPTYSGPPADPIDYFFWWNCGSPTTDIVVAEGSCGALPLTGSLPLGSCAGNTSGYRCRQVTTDPQLAPQIGTQAYPAVGSFTAKVIVQRGTASPAQAQALIAVNPSAPAAPSGLTATKPGCGQISLSWTDNSTNETGFEVYRNKPGFAGSAALANYDLIATVGANLTSYGPDTPAANVSYSYAVRAVNAGGASAATFSALVFNDPCEANLTGSSKTLFEYKANAADPWIPYSCSPTCPILLNGYFLKFRIVVRNTGFAPGFDVFIEDTLSAKLTYQAGSAVFNGAPLGPGSEAVSGQTITWGVGAAGLGNKPNNPSPDTAPWILDFQARINSTSAQIVDFLSNTARIIYDRTEPDNADNRVVTKRFGPLPFRTGPALVPKIREVKP